MLKEFIAKFKRTKVKNGLEITSRGAQIWYKDGLFHRLNGPAIEYEDGEKHWYANGLLHRLDGPAVDCIDVSDNSWWINGVEYKDEEEFKKTVLIMRLSGLT